MTLAPSMSCRSSSSVRRTARTMDPCMSLKFSDLYRVTRWTGLCNNLPHDTYHCQQGKGVCQPAALVAGARSLTLIYAGLHQCDIPTRKARGHGSRQTVGPLTGRKERSCCSSAPGHHAAYACKSPRHTERPASHMQMRSSRWLAVPQSNHSSSEPWKRGPPRPTRGTAA